MLCAAYTKEVKKQNAVFAKTENHKQNEKKSQSCIL